MVVTLVVHEPIEINRAGIREILSSEEEKSTEPGLHVIGEFGEFEALHNFLSIAAVDLLIYGVSESQATLCPRLKALHELQPELKIMLLMNCASVTTVEMLYAMGIRVIVRRGAPLERLLVFALQMALDDRTYLSPELADTVMKSRTEESNNPLTLRQMQTLHLMAQGFSPAEIGLRLQISDSAVYSLQHRMCKALHVSAPKFILFEALRRGLIELEED